jgi:hypothetical protein
MPLAAPVIAATDPANSMSGNLRQRLDHQQIAIRQVHSHSSAQCANPNLQGMRSPALQGSYREDCRLERRGQGGTGLTNFDPFKAAVSALGDKLRQQFANWASCPR